jgi:hypothetical protein
MTRECAGSGGRHIDSYTYSGLRKLTTPPSKVTRLETGRAYIDTVHHNEHTSPVGGDLPIIGRAEERDAISAAYARARAGQSQCLLVTGQAGLGKTRLVEDLRASAADARVLTGTGPSAQHYGYALSPAANVANLPGEIATAMGNGTRLTIPLEGGGTLVLDGASLSFVVIQPGAPVRAPISPVHDASPHG